MLRLFAPANNTAVSSLGLTDYNDCKEEAHCRRYATDMRARRWASDGPWAAARIILAAGVNGSRLTRVPIHFWIEIHRKESAAKKGHRCDDKARQHPLIRMGPRQHRRADRQRGKNEGRQGNSTCQSRRQMNRNVEKHSQDNHDPCGNAAAKHPAQDLARGICQAPTRAQIVFRQKSSSKTWRC